MITSRQSTDIIDEQFDVSLFKKVWDTVKEDYVAQPISDEDLFYGSLEGLVKGLKRSLFYFFKTRIS